MGTSDSLNSVKEISSNKPSTARVIPSQIQTTQEDESDTASFEINRKNLGLRTTNVPINSTVEPQDKTTHILPTVSPTKVSPSLLLSSVFTKQKIGGSSSDTEKINGSSALSVVDNSEKPTIVSVNSSTDETDFEMADKDTKKSTGERF
jgi:hypothetical protein